MMAQDKNDGIWTTNKQDNGSIQKGCIEIQVAAEESSKGKKSDVFYGVDDVPPWYLCIILGMQHYLTMFGGTIAYPYIITPHLCMKDDDPARGHIISTTLFVSGIVTFLQSTFGVRLPIVQGSSMAFLVPALTILNLPEWKCPGEHASEINITGVNISHSILQTDEQEMWQIRMRLVQGSIMAASVFEILIGFTGLVGMLLRWITPLTIAPTIALVGLPLFAVATKHTSSHWGIAIFTIILLALFSQYLRDVNIPCCSYKKSIGCTRTNYPLFKLFPVLLTITIAWLLCAVLTATNVFSDSNPARTDLRLSVLYNSPWFRFPYPGQWGLPTVTVSAVLGMIAAIFASIIESIGDYYACARLAGAPAPPSHAINRGIFIEGIGCVLSGIWGTASGTTSFSENIGAIGITKVGSRRVVQYGACIMIIFGMLSKFGALFITIPEPIIGGVFCIMFSMVSAVGLSNLQHVDLNSTRNLFVLGTSLFLGLSVPKWIEANPTSINTGVPVLDQILTVLLGTSMFVGGFLGIILDNTIPGTDEERGIKTWRKHDQGENQAQALDKTSDCYKLPLGKRFTSWKCWTFFPISPSYKERNVFKKCKISEMTSRRKEVREECVLHSVKL